MFTERHHIPLPVFVLLSKTNWSLLVFTHLLSFLALTHPLSPALHLPLCKHTLLTEPHTVFPALLNLGFTPPCLYQDPVWNHPCKHIGPCTYPIMFLPVSKFLCCLAASIAPSSFPVLTLLAPKPDGSCVGKAPSCCLRLIPVSLCAPAELPHHELVVLLCSLTSKPADSRRRFPQFHFSLASFPCW